MPYRTNDELPQSVKNVLPREALDLWRTTYNDNFPDDAAAAAAAWKAVRDAGYSNLPGQASWSKMTEEHEWSRQRIVPYPISKETLIPARFVSKIQGKIFDAQAATSKRSYSEGLRAAIQADEFAASLYVAGPERGLKYWLSGPKAAELLRELIEGDEE